MNYYNEWDSFAAEWLKQLIKDGLIPDGEVDTRSIADVEPSDLREFTQCHFFAGIGGCQEPYNSQGGVQTDLFGQEVLPVSLSQQQEKEKERTTSDTSGLSSLVLSESANLQQCLANRLQQLSDMDGSMIYKLTLRQKVTPQQRSYYQLGASARTTKGTDSSLQPSAWPTPRVADTNNLNNSPTVVQDRVTKGRATVAEIASHNVSAWPTPTTRDYKDTGDLSKSMIRKDGKTRLDSVGRVASIVPWATPTATDHSRGTKPPRPHDTGIPLTQQVSGLNPKSSTAETENTAPSQLNPRFSLWLMGYPIEWAYSAEQVTPLSRKQRQK